MAEPVEQVQTRPSVGRDAAVIFVVAAGLLGFYALFKVVSILAGLPFP